MRDDIFPWQKLVADEEARRSPDLIKRQGIVPRALTPGEIDALRREWIELHSGSASALRAYYIPWMVPNG